MIVVMLLIPPTAATAVQSTFATLQLLYCRDLAIRQSRLYVRMAHTVRDLEVVWFGGVNFTSYKRTTQVRYLQRYLRVMLNRQQHLTSSGNMDEVASDLFLRDYVECTEFGRGQLHGLKQSSSMDVFTDAYALVIG